MFTVWTLKILKVYFLPKFIYRYNVIPLKYPTYVSQVWLNSKWDYLEKKKLTNQTSKFKQNSNPRRYTCKLKA